MSRTVIDLKPRVPEIRWPRIYRECEAALEVMVARPSGLVEPFEPPELTMEASIGRSTELAGGLLVPRPPEYLKTQPAPAGGYPWFYAYPASGEPAGFRWGLPEL